MAVAVSRRVVPEPITSSQTVVLASADIDLRSRVAEQLRGIRWRVCEVSGGAEAITVLEQEQVDALIVDNWLPDLEAGEFVEIIRSMFPELDVIQPGGGAMEGGPRCSRRSELLLAMQCALRDANPDEPSREEHSAPERLPKANPLPQATAGPEMLPASANVDEGLRARLRQPVAPLPGIVGDSPAMRQLARLVRLVAPRSTTVLIQGATGSGKELVAKAIHRLGARAGKPFVTLNCAAIPESLLEAELFGHTRGAFTGAVQSRVGRVEAANGGTLFLDEIGEMPLALQAKMLRFLENGEIQRIGGNDTMRVDVRIVAATHQPLRQRAEENVFRLDLYHRLAVFPVAVPALCERMEDIPSLARFFLERFGEEAPIKRLSPAAESRLMEYRWPGNVRELAHVLERGTILAEDRPEISADEIWF